MKRALAIACLTAVGFGLFHCGSDLPDSQFDPSLCGAANKANCNRACTRDQDCTAGFYCGTAKVCTADCTENSQCASNRCNSRGKCEPAVGLTGDAAVGDSGFSNLDACVSVDVKFEKLKPTAILLIDQSSSMKYAKFPATGYVPATPPNYLDSRWQVLKDALIGPNGTPGGLVKQFEGDVAFGLQMYSARRQNPNGTSPPAGACPRFNDVAFAGVTASFNNAAAIDAVYRPAVVVDDTPTGEALLAVAGIDDAGTIVDQKGLASLVTAGPKLIILATDGEPALCSDLAATGTAAAQAKVVTAAQAAFKNKIKTFVVAVGSDINEQHQQYVANAGIGLDPVNGNAPIYRPNNVAALQQAFQSILLSGRTCTFKLNGTVSPGTEADGEVTLDGNKLTYKDPNGWILNAAGELELQGSACTSVLSTDTPALSIRFPCGAFVPR
ncbi:MAG: hypothetical protein U0174_01380 [Polyangiaceae bacterium]